MVSDIIYINESRNDIIPLNELAISATEFANASKASNTVAAYKISWATFSRWCEQHNVQALPADPKTVALYITSLARAGRKVNTIRLAMTAIAEAHRSTDHLFDQKDRILSTVWKGIRREVGIRPERKAPLLSADLKTILNGLDRGSVIGCRNAALLLVGFGGALRRSEVVSLNTNDITINSQGMKILIRKSKTDVESAGAEIDIHRGSNLVTCVVAAYENWIKISGITSGAIFRRVFPDGRIGADRLCLRAVGDIVKSCVQKVGMNPDDFGSHSLRAGFASSAALAGCNLTTIMKQTRHKSVNDARIYVRDAEIWQENATRLLL